MEAFPLESPLEDLRFEMVHLQMVLMPVLAQGRNSAIQGTQTLWWIEIYLASKDIFERRPGGGKDQARGHEPP